MWASFQRIIELITQKIVTKLSKIWVWDSGSEIRDPEKTYYGSRIQVSKRHRILVISGSATLAFDPRDSGSGIGFFSGSRIPNPYFESSVKVFLVKLQ
jgi:hypothetical protein